MGLSLARRAGIVISLLSGENSPLIDRYATKMHISHVVKGCRDKAGALRQLSAEIHLDLAEICFMGDDINDIAAMRIAGFSAAPASAAPAVLREVKLVTSRSGGNGAVRELVEALFTARGLQIEEVFARS
jgi:3-deoxy-D-manno-octulosonate 8-phosphate phosphatase (KDO 8-P phosphatase)